MGSLAVIQPWKSCFFFLLKNNPEFLDCLSWCFEQTFSTRIALNCLRKSHQTACKASCNRPSPAGLQRTAARTKSSSTPATWWGCVWRPTVPRCSSPLPQGTCSSSTTWTSRSPSRWAATACCERDGPPSAQVRSKNQSGHISCDYVTQLLIFCGLSLPWTFECVKSCSVTEAWAVLRSLFGPWEHMMGWLNVDCDLNITVVSRLRNDFWPCCDSVDGGTSASRSAGTPRQGNDSSKIHPHREGQRQSRREAE